MQPVQGVDVATIVDIDRLKAMVYDEISVKEQADNNISIINNRIKELLTLGTLPNEAMQDGKPDEPASENAPTAGSPEAVDNPS